MKIKIRKMISQDILPMINDVDHLQHGDQFYDCILYLCGDLNDDSDDNFGDSGDDIDDDEGDGDGDYYCSRVFSRWPLGSCPSQSIQYPNLRDGDFGDSGYDDISFSAVLLLLALWLQHSTSNE